MAKIDCTKLGTRTIGNYTFKLIGIETEFVYKCERGISDCMFL